MSRLASPAWMSMAWPDIVARLRELNSRERESLCAFLEGLALVDQQAAHLDLGFPNLFEFCRIEFGLSEGCIYRRIQVARKLHEYPELLTALRAGDINLTLASLLCPYLGRFPWAVLLERVQRQTKRQAVRALKDLEQEASPHETPDARVVYLGSEHYSYRLRVPAPLHHQLERVRELLSHQNPQGEWISILETLVQAYLRKHDPREQQIPAPELWQSYSSPHRYIPRALRQLVLDRSGHQCQYVSDNGRRCTQTRYLDIDHIHPLAQGGETHLANLQVLCRAHNLRKGDRISTNHNRKLTKGARKTASLRQKYIEEIGKAPKED